MSAGASLERFSLFAGGVAGRRIGVGGMAGGRCCTDGETVFVPDGASDDDVASMVALQAALIAAGSLERGALSGLRTRTSRERYLLLEGVRASRSVDAVLPRSIANAVDAIWPDGRLSTDAAHSLKRANSSEPLPLPPLWFGEIDPKRIRARRLDLSAATNRPDMSGGRIQPNDLLDRDDEDDDDECGLLPESKLLKLLTNPLNFTSPLARMLKSSMGKSRQAGTAANGAELPMGGLQSGERTGTPTRIALLTAGIMRAKPPSGPAACYPEWDVSTASYRPDRCRVAEFDAPLGASPPLPSDDFHQLRRQLVRVSRSLERHRHEERGEALDLDGLVGLVILRGAGAPVDNRIYQARRRTAPDLGVLLLLDASGSTGEIRPGGATIFDDHRQVAVNLIAACEEVGHRVAAYAFNSEGEQAVRMIRVKTFEERFSQVARCRLVGLTPSGFTRMGAAIRHATTIVAQESGCERRLVLVVSDGFPYDGANYEATYAEADTRKALEEGRDRGVAAACLNLAPADEDNRLDRVFASSAHVRIGGPADLVGEVRPLFTAALAACASGRR